MAIQRTDDYHKVVALNKQIADKTTEITFFRSELERCQNNAWFYSKRNATALAASVSIIAAVVIGLYFFTRLVHRFIQNQGHTKKLAYMDAHGIFYDPYAQLPIVVQYMVLTPLPLCGLFLFVYVPRISTQQRDQTAKEKLEGQRTACEHQKTQKIQRMQELYRRYDTATADAYSDQAFAALSQLETLSECRSDRKKEQVWLSFQNSLLGSKQQLERDLTDLQALPAKGDGGN